jgi:hypothetical protein
MTSDGNDGLAEQRGRRNRRRMKVRRQVRIRRGGWKEEKEDEAKEKEDTGFHE